ncbi:hypothetical protein KCU65_g2979, partial [Aureobasidium melanogenum]
MVKTPSSTVADQQYITVLLGKIADMTGQLIERDLEIASLTTTLKDLDNSRHASTYQYHKPPRKRLPNSEDHERITLPEGLQDRPRYEVPVNPLLPRHFSETWACDDAYNFGSPWERADPFVVLAEEQFKATLANNPLTSDLKIELLDLNDATQPNRTPTFNGIFLGDKPYSRELDDKLHEAMETSAARWKVEKKAMRYMVWNDEIEDVEAVDEGEDVPHWGARDAISEIYDKARKEGLFDPEYSFLVRNRGI